MEEIRNIEAINLDTGICSNLVLSITENDIKDIVSLKIIYNEQIFEVEGEYYFNTYQKLRDILLTNKIGLKCYGSMRNAHPSAMMSTSDKTYILTLGKQAKRKDIVCIFDHVELKDFPNTDEQEVFYQLWFNTKKSES